MVAHPCFCSLITFFSFHKYFFTNLYALIMLMLYIWEFQLEGDLYNNHADALYLRISTKMGPV